METQGEAIFNRAKRLEIPKGRMAFTVCIGPSTMTVPGPKAVRRRGEGVGVFDGENAAVVEGCAVAGVGDWETGDGFFESDDRMGGGVRVLGGGEF